MHAWQAAPGETHEDDKVSNQLLRVERDAWRAWLTTPPTTMAGVIATLEHASANYGEIGCEDEYANLAESAQYIRGEGDGDPDDVVAAGERFPAMIAAALRRIIRT